MSDDTVDELKEHIQELEDELQKLKDKKRKDHTDSAAVEKEIEEVHDQTRDEADRSGMSRRKFMKAIAGGGAALGAAAMMPSAAALDIESNNPLSYNDNFSVDTQGNINLNSSNITNAGSVEAERVEMPPPNGTTNYIPNHVIESALINGYVVGYSPTGYSIAVDPREYATDADALQKVYDEMSAAGASPGNVVIPRVRPDGTAWTISKTVKFAHDGNQILPIGYGFGSGTDAIECTITDGSPMFQIGEFGVGNGGLSIVPFGGFSATGGGRDCEAIRTQSAVHWRLSDLRLGNFASGPGSDGAIVIDSASFTWVIDDFEWVNGSEDQDVVVLVNSESSQQTNVPGNGVIRAGFEVNGDCRTAVRSTVKNPVVKFNGYIEEAGNATAGTAALHWETGSGSLTIGTESQFGSNNNEQVYFDGEELTAYGGNLGNVSNGNENIYHIGPNTAQVIIHPFTRLGNIAGHDIVIDAPPSNPSIIPFESQLTGTVSGTVGVGRPNGMELIDEGTVSISASGTATVNIAGSATFAFDVRFALDEADPSADVQIRKEWMWDDSAGQTKLKFIETSGSGGGTIRYKVYRNELS